jgi:hypothetical protein
MSRVPYFQMMLVKIWISQADHYYVDLTEVYFCHKNQNANNIDNFTQTCLICQTSADKTKVISGSYVLIHSPERHIRNIEEDRILWGKVLKLRLYWNPITLVLIWKVGGTIIFEILPLLGEL